jgi:hypothetical protein
MHIRIDPSFFLTGSTGDDQGEILDSITYKEFNSAHCRSISSAIGLANLRGRWYMGVLSVNFIWWLVTLARPTSASPVLNTGFTLFKDENTSLCSSKDKSDNIIFNASPLQKNVHHPATEHHHYLHHRAAKLS